MFAPLVDGPRSLPPTLPTPSRLPDRDYTVRSDADDDDDVQEASRGVAPKDMDVLAMCQNFFMSYFGEVITTFLMGRLP